MLEDWGWDEAWAASVPERSAADARPARVVGQERDRWAVQTEAGPGVARVVSGSRLAVLPAVGDWVLVEPGPMPSDPWSVTAVLPRRSVLSRGAPGTGDAAQVLAVNVDRIWIVHGLDSDVNVRRLERYLAVAWQSGAVPEMVLTKADLARDVEQALADALSVGPGTRVWVVSSTDAESVERLRGSLFPGITVVLLGPSGAGKSTLVSLLDPGQRPATAPVRERDRKGRHTTTRREIFRLRGGALLLDTPGIRELRLWALDEGLGQAFPDIDELAVDCRFRDCRHEEEPGCAVRTAVADGRIDPGRLAGFKKLQAEADYQARKTDPRAQQAALAEHKSALKTLKYHHKFRRPD